MNVSEFKHLVEVTRARYPRWFALESDPPASIEAIDRAEARLGVRFPEQYRQFLLLYGGGYFAFSNVFSTEDGSEWNVVERNRGIGALDEGRGFLVFSDPGTGDLYAFRVTNSACDTEVWVYDHDSRRWTEAFADLFEFLRQRGLTQ